MTSVLILGGGPDAEREVSIASAKAIHQGCLDAGLDASLMIVDRPTLDQVQSWRADVVFPALHGRFGEGGGLQHLLEQCNIAFVGCKAQASRMAMDKMGTKLIAARCGILTPAACIFDAEDIDVSGASICPLGLPVVIKPVADGSSVGLHICHDEPEWNAAIEEVRADFKAHPHRVYMVERLVEGREMTVSVLGDGCDHLRTLPTIEIAPAQGVYDFQAKYERNDTVYTPDPELSDEARAGMADDALRICIALGVRHLARVDFLLTDDTHWGLLEVNTMPGFTSSSLMPMAAAADSMEMPDLCAHLVRCALEDHVKIHPGIQTR